jgi:hypothetical protein
MPPFLPTRRGVLAASALLVPGLLAAGRAAAAAEIRVTDHDSLVAALRAARGGETILLEAGDYGRVELQNGKQGDFAYASPVTLRSVARDAPAVMEGMELQGFANLSFDGLSLAYRAGAGAKLNKRCFRIVEGSAITVRNSLFRGHIVRAGEGEAADIGLPTGIGLTISRSIDVLVENNLILDFHRGFAMGEGRNVVIRGNELRGLRMDGMIFTKMRSITIEANFIHDFRRSTAKTDHADMIQFWTNGAEFATTDITIRGNLLFAGPGGATQSIFMRNDMVDRGLAGREMFYRNIRIEENVIINGHTHGITLGETEGAVIANNTLLRNPLFAARADRDRKVRIPRIKLSPASLEARITGNMAAALPEAQPGWSVADNLVVQDLSPRQPGYYGDLFQNPFGPDTQDLANYLYLGDPGAGAALLRPSADRSAFRPRAA